MIQTFLLKKVIQRELSDRHKKIMTDSNIFFKIKF